jgi:hypothetical protein
MAHSQGKGYCAELYVFISWGYYIFGEEIIFKDISYSCNRLKKEQFNSLGE